ncbi:MULTISPECIES: Hsp20/alpha crystallin family protein [unclassified Roseateles]|uniref:Hsp20/alpha crystallin family protein n=1 Tax=unclassified Roseateles TaxID=2626991 RepID=UPI0006F1E85D|nr:MULTISPECIES: Hsp20/alpha crystallin family protein [unclassified Roseateles]KQW43423.1 heat-shock protein Hsp20 [Pelomonas sp. Root405]KRA71161.1 heat-shock protein Hsp20 [Pelomonas sp. Root662]
MYSSLWTFPSSFFSDFDRLHREFDEHFGAVGAPSSIRSVAPGAFPAINVGNTPESVEIYAFAPGLDAAKLDVTVDRGVLSISGERAATAQEDGARTYSRERFSGSFRRAISLPDDADAAQVKASYRDGILRISVARQASAQPRRIAIQ